MSRHLVMRTHHAMSTHQTSQPCRQPHQRPFPCRAPLPEASRHRCRASCCVYVCACVSPRLRHGLLTLYGRAGAICTLHCTQHCMYAYARVVSCIPHSSCCTIIFRHIKESPSPTASREIFCRSPLNAPAHLTSPSRPPGRLCNSQTSCFLLYPYSTPLKTHLSKVIPFSPPTSV